MNGVASQVTPLDPVVLWVENVIRQIHVNHSAVNTRWLKTNYAG